MPNAKKERSLAYLLLILNAVLWGVSPPIIKYAPNYISPEQFLFFRYALATLLFLSFFLSYKAKTKLPNSKLIFLALLGTPLTLLPLFIGLSQTTSLESSILESVSPLFVVILGVFLLEEKITKKECFGLTITFLGVTLFTLEPLLLGQKINFTSSGNFLILFSDVLWAIFLILSKKWKPDLILLNFYSFLLAIPFFSFLMLKGGQSFLPTSQALPSLLFMAIFGSIVAFWAYQAGQKRIEASEAAIFTYLKPLFTLPLSIFWLRESISPIALIATIILATGVYLYEKR